MSSLIGPLVSSSAQYSKHLLTFPASTIYGMSYFLPTIVNQLGYTGQQANLLTIPCYVCAAILTILLCWISDRIKKRSILIVCLLAAQLTGFLFTIASSASGKYPGLTYAGCFISTACCYPAYVLTIVSRFLNHNLLLTFLVLDLTEYCALLQTCCWISCAYWYW